MTSLVKYFDSTMPNVPALNGSGSGAGSLINLLDTLLVNGYGSKTVNSITQSGGVATLTSSGHQFQLNQVILIAGANEADYNGEFRVVSVPDANTVTFAIAAGAPASATGTLTAKVAPLGWTKPFSGTNLAAYRATGGTVKHYLRVNDTYAAYARVHGAETMSDVNTGTNIYYPDTGGNPNVFNLTRAQWVKSWGSLTANDYILIGDDKFFHFMPINATYGPVRGWYYFGEFTPQVAGDTYNSILCGEDYASQSTYTYAGYYTDGVRYNLDVGGTTAFPGYASRNYLGVAVPPRLVKVMSPGVGISSAMVSGNDSAMPPGYNPVTGNIPLLPSYLCEGLGGGSGRVIRGILPGAYFVAAQIGGVLPEKQPITATLLGTSRVLRAAFVSGQAQSGQGGYVMFDTTGPW